MKYAFIIAAVLVLSIFASAAVFASPNIKSEGSMKARTDNDNRKVKEIDLKSITSENLESLEINSSDIDSSLEEKSDLKKVGFAKIWRGFGYINNEDSGYLISVLWAKQGLVSLDADSNQVENYTKIRSLGFIRIANLGVYKLVRDTTDSNSSDDNLRFYILPTSKRQVDPNESKKDSIGTLILNKDKEYSNLITWTGTLALESGDLKGSWDVALDTDNHVVRKALPEQASRGEGKKLGFFERFKFWKSR